MHAITRIVRRTQLPRRWYTSHTTDSYAKDVDSSPANDTVHAVDPDSTIQRSVDPPNEDHKYNPKDQAKDRYGARPSWVEDKGKETSNPDEGPADKAKGGRS